MSCYIVEQGHINTLVQWASHCNAMPEGYTKQETAQLLYAANVRSVNHRYKLAEPETFTYKEPTSPVPTHAEAFDLIKRLDYQCDNWPEWEGSTAQQLLKNWALLASREGSI
jgi:hypothetical protein